MGWGGGGPGEAQTYRVYFPKRLLRMRCPVEGCLGGASNRINIRVNFAHFHARDTIVILEEGNRPYPRLPQCDMFVSHRSLNGRHLTTDFCRQGAERKRRRLAEEGALGGAEASFSAYGIPLAPVTTFSYVERVLY